MTQEHYFEESEDKQILDEIMEMGEKAWREQETKRLRRWYDFSSSVERYIDKLERIKGMERELVELHREKCRFEDENPKVIKFLGTIK